MTDKKEEVAEEVIDKKATYIIRNVTELPGYKRKDLKVGMVVELDEKLGDKYCNRHILKKGVAVAKTPADKQVEVLKAENEKLKKEIDSLKKPKTLVNGKK